jgi:diamine N-acetyltransferase
VYAVSWRGRLAAPTGRGYGRSVELHEIDAANWQACAAIRPAPDQERFVAPVAWYLCLCHYEDIWQPLAIVVDGEVIGHAMWAVDPGDGSHWIGGLVIAADRQRLGHGRAAVTALLGHLRDRGASEAAISYHADNDRARALYLSLGFRETGERADDEVVARLALR